jgi:hypothetical protein
MRPLLFPSPCGCTVERGRGRIPRVISLLFQYLRRQQHALLPPPLVPPHKGEGDSVLIAVDRPLL